MGEAEVVVVPQMVESVENMERVEVETTDLKVQPNEALEEFLGTAWYSAMKTELEDIGVEALDDLNELEAEDIDLLAAKLKKIQAKKFRKKISDFIDCN